MCSVLSRHSVDSPDCIWPVLGHPRCHLVALLLSVAALTRVEFLSSSALPGSPLWGDQSPLAAFWGRAPFNPTKPTPAPLIPSWGRGPRHLLVHCQRWNHSCPKTMTIVLCMSNTHNYQYLYKFIFTPFAVTVLTECSPPPTLNSNSLGLSLECWFTQITHAQFPAIIPREWLTF